MQGWKTRLPRALRAWRSPGHRPGSAVLGGSPRARCKGAPMRQPSRRPAPAVVWPLAQAAQLRFRILHSRIAKQSFPLRCASMMVALVAVAGEDRVHAAAARRGSAARLAQGARARPRGWLAHTHGYHSFRERARDQNSGRGRERFITYHKQATCGAVRAFGRWCLVVHLPALQLWRAARYKTNL